MLRELSSDELDLAAGGLSFGYGDIPGFLPDEAPQGYTFDHSFGNGWSLSGGFNRDGDRGIAFTYVW